jgi:hypothetical protein
MSIIPQFTRPGAGAQPSKLAPEPVYIITLTTTLHDHIIWLSIA